MKILPNRRIDIGTKFKFIDTNYVYTITDQDEFKWYVDDKNHWISKDKLFNRITRTKSIEIVK